MRSTNDWKENCCTVPKDRFPQLLKKCIDNSRKENIRNNLKTGFKAVGIVPLGQKEVRKRFPNDRKKKKESEDIGSSNNLVH